MRPVIRLAVWGLLSSLLLASACREGGDAGRAAREPVRREGLEAHQFTSMNAFALDYLRAVRPQTNGKSFGAAPFSAYTTLTVFASASEDDTLKRTANALHLSKIVVGDLSDAVMAVDDDIVRTPEKPFRSHNGLFMVWPIMLDPDFKDSMNSNFGVELIRLGSAGVGSKNRVNEWAAKRTNNQAGAMVGDLNKEMIFFGLNPVQIGGEWKTGFDASLTAARPFKSLQGEQMIPTMSSSGTYQATETSLFSSVTLPYRESNVQATFLLPKSGSPEELLDRLTPSIIYETLTSTKTTEIQVQIPKFKLDTSLDLKKAAPNFGASHLFAAPIDLRYMSVELRGDYAMTSWTQRVLADFSEAGDAPRLQISAGPILAFDRPFIWLVSDSKTGVILAGGIFYGQDQKQ